MAYKNKVRINIAVSLELNDRLVEMAKRMNMSKSSLCSNLISQQVDNYERAWQILSNPQIINTLIDKFDAPKNATVEKNDFFEAMLNGLNDDKKE